jgi:RHS repeat-associated protein
VALTYDTTANGANGLGCLTQAATGAYWAQALGDTTTCGGPSVTETYSSSAGGLITSKGYGKNWPVSISPNYFVSIGPSENYTYDTEGHQTSYSGSGGTFITVDQRMYSSTYGRFTSPDRYVASGGTTDPGGYNRYSYTRGDPVNRVDPRGMVDCYPDEGCDCDVVNCVCSEESYVCVGISGTFMGTGG